MNHVVRIIHIEQVTHDVKCFRMEKPEGYEFLPGHAADVAINKPGMEEQVRPFTFTALTRQPYLEFTIKRYADHNGVTDKLHQLKVGDELIISDSWGAIDYKGPGYFIAGGAGITPFIAILRTLYDENIIPGNKLFFSNKTDADIIYKDELVKMLDGNVVFILTRQQSSLYMHGRVDEKFIKEQIPDLSRHFYICGPDPMVAELVSLIQKAGASADAVVFEK